MIPLIDCNGASASELAIPNEDLKDYITAYSDAKKCEFSKSLEAYTKLAARYRLSTAITLRTAVICF
jgi:hypothetical protein